MTPIGIPEPPTGARHRGARRHAPSRAPLRALVVTHVYPWPGDPFEGGFLHRHVRHLAEAGVRCRVLVVRPGMRGLPRGATRLTWLRMHPRWAWWPRVLDGVPVDYVFYPRALRPADDVVPAACGAVVDALVRRGPALDADVVYAQWLWPCGAIGLAIRERFGVPLATISRGNDMNEWQEDWPAVGGHVMRALRGADLVLTNSAAHRERVIGLVPECARRSAVVYNGCDRSLFRPATDRGAVRERLGLPAGGHLLLFCGRVSARKGAFELADAWEQIAPRLPDWRLVVLGPPRERAAADRLREAVERTGGRVLLVGEVPPRDVPAYMQASDLLVHPSHAEGVANVTFEAMAAGLPVISTAVDGQPELVEPGRTGLLVPPRDPAALAAAIGELAADPHRLRRLGAAARAEVARRFDARRQATRLATLLGQVAAGDARVAPGSAPCR